MLGALMEAGSGATVELDVLHPPLELEGEAARVHGLAADLDLLLEAELIGQGRGIVGVDRVIRAEVEALGWAGGRGRGGRRRRAGAVDWPSAGTAATRTPRIAGSAALMPLI